MELLLIRNGEVAPATGVKTNADSNLTENGLRQVTATALFLKQNYNLHGFVGLVSPSLRTLMTASIISEITGVQFTVESDLREFKFEKRPEHVRDGGLRLPDRSLLFQNIKWPVKQWQGESNFFPIEGVEEFAKRCHNLLYSFEPRKYDKVLLVTHSSPEILITDYALGKTLEESLVGLNDTMNFVQTTTARTPASAKDDFLFLQGIKYAGMCSVAKEELQFFNKTVYDKE